VVFGTGNEAGHLNIEPWQEDDELCGGLRVTCPPDIASHSRQQDFYFGPDFLLRRHDYHVEASGGFAAAQYVLDLSHGTGNHSFHKEASLYEK
jgi:hypothetical protein